MTANPRFCAVRFVIGAYRSAGRLRARRLLPWLTFALCAVASATDAVDARLAHLEQLAGRQPAQAQQELDTMLQGRQTLDERASLRVELIRALIADAQYRSGDVLALYARWQERLQRLNDPRMQALFEHVRAAADYQLGRYDDEWLALQEELRQAGRAGDDDLTALAMVNRVRFFMSRGDYQAAAAAVADAEHRVRGAQAGAEVAFASGLLAQNVGDWQLALRANEEARAKFEAVTDRTGVADCLAGAGLALYRLGRAPEAIAPLQEAASIYRAVEDNDGEAIAHVDLAQVYAQLNETDLALDTIARAIQELARVDEPWQLAQARVEQAAMLVQAKRAAQALRLVDQARPVILDKGDPNSQARLHDVSAQALAALGRVEAAYLEMRVGQETSRRRTEQLVARQLAAQRGRLESERLIRDNALLRSEAESSQHALAEAIRAARLQQLALALGATVVLGALFAVWRQRSLTRRFARLAEIDALTGVLNRGIFLESGQRTMNRCRSARRPCAVLMIDVDRFKDINDRYGHVVGDRALRAVSASLKLCLRPEDLIGRYGGEEFALLLPGANAAVAAVIAERLRAAVGELHPDWAPGAAPLTVSGGIAVSTAGLSDLNELLARADRALYRAKDAGRDRMEFEPPPLAAAVG
jgi:diguanylate cyclase (GGDEF)-like protein